MNNREKLLGVLVLAILIGLGARSVHTRLNDAYSGYVRQVDAKEKELFQVQLATSEGMLAAERLNGWKDRSLPSEDTMANLQYQDWLWDQLTSAGLEVDTPTVTFSRSPIDKVTLLTYSVAGEGTLKSLIDFLYGFYTAKHFHKISSLQVTPDDEGKTLTVSMKVEAYSLWDAERTDALAEGQSGRLALDSPEEYRDSIVGRNIFAVYKKPAPPQQEVIVAQPERPAPFEHAKHAKATAIVAWNDKPQVWINVQTTGAIKKLFAGDSFEIDDLSVKILEIGTRTIVFEADGQTYSVKLGDSLRDGKPVDLEKAS